jgi:hypothetical protein
MTNFCEHGDGPSSSMKTVNYTSVFIEFMSIKDSEYEAHIFRRTSYYVYLFVSLKIPTACFRFTTARYWQCERN